MSCFIQEVLAPNGMPSELYKDLLHTTKDPARALLLYLDAKAMSPLRREVDRNGEVLLKELLHDLLTEDEVKTFLRERPDLVYMPVESKNPVDGIDPVDKGTPADSSGKRKKRKEQWEERFATLDQEQQYIQNLMKTTLSKLEDKRATATETDEKEWYDRQIKRLKSQRNQVFWSDTLKAIRDVAVEQLSWVDDVLSRRRPTMRELSLAMDLVDAWSWKTTQNFLSPTQREVEAEWNELLQDISTMAHKQALPLSDTIRKNVARSMNEAGIAVQESELTTHDAISFMRRTMFDLTKVDNKLAQYIGGVLKRAAKNQAGSLAQISTNLARLSKGVDQSKLLQRDENGRLTGNLITPYSIKYMSAVKKAEADFRKLLWAAENASTAYNAKALRTAAYRNYYHARRTTDIAIDIRFWVVDGFKTSKHADKESYIQYLVDTFGPDMADVHIQDAEELLSKYQDELAAYRERVFSEISGQTAEYEQVDGRKESPDEYLARRLKEWKDANSPEVYLKEFYSHGGAQYTSTDGHRWVKHVARKKDSKGTDLGYYDAAYAALTEKERAFLGYVLDLSGTLLAYLPRSLTQDLGAGFLPVVQKTLTELVLGGGSWATLNVQGGFDRARNALMDALTDPTIQRLNEQENKAYRSRLNVDGEDVRKIPIRFVEGVTQRSGESKEDFQRRLDDLNSGRTFDIVKVMEMFAGMAINYKAMSDVENLVLLAQRVVHESKEVREQGGNPLYDTAGKLVTRKGRQPNLTAMVDYAIDGMVYGNKRLDSEYTTDAVLYSFNPKKNVQSRVKANKLKKEMSVLQEQFDKGEIKPEEYEEGKRRLEASYKALGGRKFSGGRALDSLLKFTQLKGMGYNFTAGIANVGFGMLANITHAASGLDFNGQEVLTAIGIMTRAWADPESKAAVLIRMLDALYEVTEIGYGKNADRSKFRKLEWVKNPYETQRRTEFLLQGVSIVAQMLHTKIQDSNGKERSLWDAYNKDGSWNEAEFGPQPEEWKAVGLTGAQRNKFTKFRDKVIQVNKMLHGNYDPHSLVEAKKWVMGRAFLMFRSWIAEGVEWRFGHEHYDYELDRKIKGRWLSFRDIKREHGYKNLMVLVFKMLLWSKKGNLSFDGEQIDEIDLANMRSNIMELQILLGMMVGLLMLRAAFLDDDDEEEGVSLAAARILISQIYRVEADVLFYGSPQTVLDILKSPIPAMKTVADLQTAFEDSFTWLTDDTYRGQDPWIKWLKAFPVGSQGYKMWYMANNDINWDNF